MALGKYQEKVLSRHWWGTLDASLTHPMYGLGPMDKRLVWLFDGYHECNVSISMDWNQLHKIAFDIGDCKAEVEDDLIESRM